MKPCLHLTFLYFFVSIFLLVGCETKEYQGEKIYNVTTDDLNEGSFFSKVTFSGITNITDITDTTLNLNWTSSASAEEYYIYIVDQGSENFHSKISAPASSVQLSGLESNKSYMFQVRMKDNLSLLDSNTIEVSATTLSLPASPYYLYRSSPTKLNDIIRTPSITVFGVNAGDTVKLYSDACITEVSQGVADSSFITLTSSELVPDISYNFYAKRKNIHNNESSCSFVSASYNLNSCPDGYVLAPKSPNFAEEEFCVMKYEAKAWSDSDSDNIVDSIEVDSDGCQESGCTTPNWGINSFIPGSDSTGLPWRMLDMDTAKSECRSLGSNYDLISNNEWMAIAENLENQNSNWSGGAVGSGCFYRGNNGSSDACGYDNFMLDSGTGRNSKASMTLSNGNVIWDFSGNVAEWVDWAKEDEVTLGPRYCTDSWSEISSTFCLGALGFNEFRAANPAAIPSSSYNSTYGIGMIEGGAGGALVRGGSYQYGLYAGVYSASFAQQPNTTRKEIGFRCVYRIPENL